MTRRRLLFSALVLLLILAGRTAQGAQWVELSESEGRAYFYDTEGITYPSKGIPQVWAKSVPMTEKKRQESIFILTMIARRRDVPLTDLGTYAYNTMCCEIDCARRQMRLWDVSWHDAEGKSLLSLPRYVDEWGGVLPGSPWERLADIVCPRESP